MTAKVISKSKYGLRVEGLEGWLNYGNYYEGSKEFNVGDTVNITYKGKYLQSLEVVSVAEAVPIEQTAPIKPAYGQKSPETQAQINRSTAAKIAFGGPYFAHLLTTMDHSEATQVTRDFADYIVRYISGVQEAATTETK